MDKWAALYARVSTDAQFEEGYSIDAQKQMLEAYCVSKQIERYEPYIDGGYSGSHIDRPSLTRLIDDIGRDHISHVIVYKLDRLSRSQKDTLYLIEDVLMPHGVAFVSLNENLDTATPIGRAMLGIMSAFAQLERETIKERTRMGMKERVKNGLWRGGGKIPFGYDYDAQAGILVPNADAPTVKSMYEAYLSGASLGELARRYHLKYDRLAEQILKRKTNCGYIVYNGTVYRGRHQPIVSEALYEEAMTEMNRRARGYLYPSRHLLAGLLVCGVCGAKMRYQKWGKQGYKIYCYSQDKGKPHLSRSAHCTNEKVWADEVEKAVLDDLFAMGSYRVSPPDDCREDEGSAVRLLDLQEEKYRRRLKNLYRLYGDEGNDALLEIISEAEKGLDEIRKRRLTLEKQKKTSAENGKQRQSIQNAAEAWQYLTDTEKQHLIRSFVEKIIIIPGRIDIFYHIEETPQGTPPEENA